MKEVSKVSGEQILFITYSGACGNIVFNFTWVTTVAGKPFWIAVFIGVIAVIPLVVWMMRLGKSYEGGTIFTMVENVTGKFFNKILLLFYILINSVIAVCILNMFTGSVKVFFLMNTPPWVIMLFTVLICTVFSGSEIKALGRLVEILMVLLTAVYFTGFFFSFFKEFKIEYIVPVFDSSPAGFVKGILITAGNTSECLLLLMVLSGLPPEPQKKAKNAAKGLLYWAVVLSFAIFIMAGTISTELLSRVAEAGISVSKSIQIGEFIRGVEVLILFTYQFITISKVSLIIYSSWVSLGLMLNRKKSFLQLSVIALIVFSLSVWMNSYNMAYFLSLIVGSYILLPFSLLILLLAVWGRLLQKRKAGGDAI